MLRSRRLCLQVLGKRTLSVHEAAVKGFTGEGAAAYEMGRPSYDNAMAQTLSILKPSGSFSTPEVKILELGSGTGKFTDSFVTNVAKLDSALVYEYTASEPSEGFRAKLASKQLKGVVVSDGVGEAIPAADSSLDAVIVAQAFHWMANGQTLKEVHRVLRPNASLIMLWNSYDYRFNWLRQLDDSILSPAYGADTPRQQNEKWRLCFQAEDAKKMFSSLHGWYSSYSHVGDRNLIVNRIFSTSVIAKQDPDAQLKTRQKLDDILDKHPELEQCRSSGVFTIPYTTHLAWAHKRM